MFYFVSDTICGWPGRVPDADLIVTDSLGNPLDEFEAYDIGTQATYECWRDGYSAFPATALRCVRNVDGAAVWSGNPPECRGQYVCVSFEMTSPVLKK